MKQNISESEKFMQSYNYILQEVKKKWIRSDCKMIGISKWWFVAERLFV